MIERLISCITCNCIPNDRDGVKKIQGKVVLMKKNVLDLNDFVASASDRLGEVFLQRVSLQLISKVNVAADSTNGAQAGGIVGKPAYLDDWITSSQEVAAGESCFKVTFDWDEDVGVPGAFIIKNDHPNEFLLKTVTLVDVPSHGRIHFVCNSWIYPLEKYHYDRVFFANQTYLPSETPLPLLKYRKQELENLRGNGTEKFEEHDRVYQYALYNDLGNPDKGPEYARHTLGGSSDLPYPRRGKTGRKPSKSDPTTEKRLSILKSLDIYVPRDERFGHLKMSDFLAYAFKSIVQVIQPELEAVFDKTINEFDSFQDVLDLYEGGLKLPAADKISKLIPFEFLKELFRTDDAGLLKYPMPAVVKADRSAWRTDFEFGREMLAGVNPVSISRLEEFPPASKLDVDLYGDHTSKITREHLEDKLEGLTIEEALENNRLYILNHHESLMPYVRKINDNTSTKIYATRTILFLEKTGTLKPLAIELSKPHPNGDALGPVSEVFTPAEEGVDAVLWQLAKAYAAVNDSGVHQLISHWLHTHAAIEPFVIVTNRQLSVLHPIYKLLHPHFRDSMFINATARQILINAGGLLEITVFPGKYAMEMSSVLYKDWVFTEQALPKDLLKRGMAVEDPEAPHGLRLLIEDYPYAVDGLKIWSAIETWVKDYCTFYYKSDKTVQDDAELQSWWHELVTEGHGDKKDAPWWPKMQTVGDLIQSCTIIIWIASALHAAVNFGQYPYAGYMPNRPTISRRLMPEKDTPEYQELTTDPDKAFLKTVTPQLQTLLGISVIEILSRHSSDEVYLGQRADADWTADKTPLSAFDEFGKRLAEIEKSIIALNNDEKLKNRVGPVKIPYTLLYPTSGVGITGKGIPNSVSI
ncbi:unnamed protein product [Rhodiola kirilowii]